MKDACTRGAGPIASRAATFLRGACALLTSAMALPLGARRDRAAPSRACADAFVAIMRIR